MSDDGDDIELSLLLGATVLAILVIGIWLAWPWVT